MDTEKRVIVGRPINGISINGLEYLLDENDKEKKFANKKEAVLFLKDNGFSDKDVEYFVFEEIEDEKEKPGKEKKLLKKPPQKEFGMTRMMTGGGN